MCWSENWMLYAVVTTTMKWFRGACCFLIGWARGLFENSPFVLPHSKHLLSQPHWIQNQIDFHFKIKIPIGFYLCIYLLRSKLNELLKNDIWIGFFHFQINFDWSNLNHFWFRMYLIFINVICSTWHSIAILSQSIAFTSCETNSSEQVHYFSNQTFLVVCDFFYLENLILILFQLPLQRNNGIK